MQKFTGTIVSIGGDSIYKIYVDTYFLFNFWMNLWVLFLCRFFIHSNVKKKKVVFAAFLMGVGEVLVLCVPFGNSSIKILLGFGGITAWIIYWLFRPKSRPYFLKLLTYSYFAIFLLGGLLILTETFLGRKKVSMFSWGIAVVLLVVLLEKIYIKINTKSEFREVILTFSEQRQCIVKALVDSGNGLTEPISKKPVSVVNENAVEEYKNLFQEEKFRLIPFHSVGEKQGILEAYFIEKLEIKNEGENVIVQNPIIAITKDGVSANETYQMILHPALLKQGGLNCDF